MRKIRLTENQLHRVILNTAKRLIREGAWFNAEDYDEDDVNEFARMSTDKNSDEFDNLHHLMYIKSNRNVSPHSLLDWDDYIENEEKCAHDARMARNYLDIYGNDDDDDYNGIEKEQDVYRTLIDSPHLSDIKQFSHDYQYKQNSTPYHRYMDAVYTNSTPSYEEATELEPYILHDYNYNSRGYKKRASKL